MKTLKAAQRHDDGEPTGVWDYVSIRKRRGRPIGYCAGMPATTKEEVEERFGPNAPDDWDDEEGVWARDFLDMIDRNRKKVEQFGHKYHDDGHDSKEAAEKCYGEYLWDQRTTLHDPEEAHATSLDDVKGTKQTFECQVDGCEEVLLAPTATMEVYLGAAFYFCPEHHDEDRIGDRVMAYARGTSWQS